MNYFSKFHPITNFMFFFFVILLNMITTNIIIAVSFFVMAIINCLYFDYRHTFSLVAKFVFPLLIFVTIINGFFNHSGETVLFYLFNNQPFTLESMVIGLRQGLVFTSVIMWFDYYSKTVTSEKFLFLFSKIAPNISLLVSMVFRFIPRLNKKAKDIKDAQIGMGAEEKSSLKNSLKVFSALVSDSMESSVQTAITMKSRGFESGKRKPFSRYKFLTKDILFLLISGTLFSLYFVFSKYAFLSFLFISLLGFLPFAINVYEDLKWSFLKSKI